MPCAATIQQGDLMTAKRSQRDPGVRILACECAPASALAAEVAARIDRDGPALAPPLGAIVLDGCDDRCESRVLAAEDVPTFAVSLRELGVTARQDLDAPTRSELAERILSRLRSGHVSSRRHGSPRPAPPKATSSTAERHDTDDYLYAIHLLGSPVAACGTVLTRSPVLAAHVARFLSISRPSAGAMLDNLEHGGLITRGADRRILLTERGHAAAERVIRRQRIVECFLVDFLGYPQAQAHDWALSIRRGFDEIATERTAAGLGMPARCPHGWPTDAAAEHRWLASLVSLSVLPVRTRARVAALGESDGELLARLDLLGLSLGTEVEPLAHSGARTLVSVGGVERSLARTETDAVFVEAPRQPGG
jgi:DtxR family Mn-dependent transcriptional regulator